MPAVKRLGRRRETNLRSVLDAILYMARTGCQWRMLPKEFPPFTTVQGYFYDWRDNGLFENINFHLLLSFAVTPPTLARLGTYRMLSAENPPIGFGAGKTEKWWIMGRSQDQFGPEGPEVSTSAHVALRLYGTRQKADGLLEIRT